MDIQGRSDKRDLVQKQKRNQRNAIVSKINSLIDFKREGELTEVVTKRKLITKVPSCSQADRNSFKREKNKESARLARERKKLYTTLLEKKIESLEVEQKESIAIQEQLQSYLASIKSREQMRMEADEVEQYFLRENRGNVGQPVGKKMDLLLDEMYNLAMPCLVRNIKQSCQMMDVEVMLRDPTGEEKTKAKQIIERVVGLSSDLNKIFLEVRDQNTKLKSFIKEDKSRPQMDFENEFHLDAIDSDSAAEEVFFPMPPKSKLFLNVNKAEEILTRAIAFLDSTADGKAYLFKK